MRARSDYSTLKGERKTVRQVVGLCQRSSEIMTMQSWACLKAGSKGELTGIMNHVHAGAMGYSFKF